MLCTVCDSKLEHIMLLFQNSEGTDKKKYIKKKIMVFMIWVESHTTQCHITPHATCLVAGCYWKNHNQSI